MRRRKRERVSLSHRSGFSCHYYDKTKRRNVTEGHMPSSRSSLHEENDMQKNNREKDEN
jgi:hypothetical protein